MVLLFGSLFINLYMKNASIEDIKLKSLISYSFIGMCSGLIKAYVIDRIIVFKNESFISGFDEVKYANVSSIKEVKRFRGYPEDLVTIEFSYYKKYIGFDKLLESDFTYLNRKIIEGNNVER